MEALSLELGGEQCVRISPSAVLTVPVKLLPFTYNLQPNTGAGVPGGAKHSRRSEAPITYTYWYSVVQFMHWRTFSGPAYQKGR